MAAVRHGPLAGRAERLPAASRVPEP